MNYTVMVMVMVMVMVTAVLFKNKDFFEGRMCFNTEFSIPSIYNPTKSFIDYKKFKIQPKMIIESEKDFSPKAWDFYIGLPSRSLGKL